MIVASAMFMQNLDSTVIATALPAMARAFGADPVGMNVALTSYMLSLAVFIPASGWVADRFGARRVFRLAIAVFALGSVLCGMANDLPWLVGARVVQGMGGAMMIPVGRLVLLRATPKSQLVSAMAWLTMPALVGPVVGPPIGGLIVTYADWRWIFYINVPIGVAGMWLATRFITEHREPRPGRLDVAGLALSGTALAALMFGFETAGRGELSAFYTMALLGIGGAAAVAFYVHARRTPAPVLDFSLMRFPSFGVSVISGSLFRIGIGAIPFLLPLMLQVGFGESAARSGAITFASSAGALVMKPVAVRTLRRLGFRSTLLWNGLLSAALIAAIAGLRPGWPAWAVYAVLLAGGFFRSLQFTAYNSLAYAEVPPERMSAATSLYSMLQQLFLTLGVAAGASALHVSMGLARHAAPETSDFSLAFLIAATVSLLAAPTSQAMPKHAGRELTEAG